MKCACNIKSVVGFYSEWPGLFYFWSGLYQVWPDFFYCDIGFQSDSTFLFVSFFICEGTLQTIVYLKKDMSQLKTKVQFEKKTEVKIWHFINYINFY